MPQAASLADPRTQELQRHFGLTYQVPYADTAQEQVGLRGKHVLEVGGTLPKAFVLDELGAASWTGIEYLGYYDEAGLTQDPTRQRLRIDDAEAASGRYNVLSGRIEDLPPALFQGFDVVFSIATFEHLDRLPVALDRMYRALKPGGRLFSMFSPIWSSCDGHHLHPVTDQAGAVFDKKSDAIPPWGHLLLSPPGMYARLRKVTDADTAGEIVYKIYNANCINRLFAEDYVQFFKETQFKIDVLQGIFHTKVPKVVSDQLTRLHPTRKHFSNGGLLAVFTRA